MDKNPLIDGAGMAFAFHYHRDKMNAATHMANPRFSPITFELADGLRACGVDTPEIREVRSHAGHYPQDRGREMIQ